MAAFAVTNGLRRAVLAKTRQEFYRTNVMLGLMDRSEESRFRSEGQGRLFLQRRGTSSAAVQKDDVRNSDRTAVAWGTKKYADANEIQVNLGQFRASRYVLPRLDNAQSPLNEVEDYRRRISLEIRNAIEDDFVAFFRGLAATGGATANGNAGQISEVNVGKTTSADSDFFDPAMLETHKASAGSTISDNWMIDIIDDVVLWAKRNNLIDGDPLYGGIPATLYLVMPPELFQKALMTQLEGKTQFRLEELGNDMLQRSAVFGTVPFAGRLGLQKLTIFAPNSLPKPAGTTGSTWDIWAGYTAAVVGGIGDEFSRIWDPSTNPDGDAYDLYQKVTPFNSLLNGDGIRRYKLLAHDAA